MFGKSTFSGFLGKGLGQKLIGGAKGLGHILDNPIVQAGIGAVNPSLGAGLATAKRMGLLEKLKG